MAAVEEALVFRDWKQALKFFALFSVLGLCMDFVTGAAIAGLSGRTFWLYPDSSLVFTHPVAAPLWGFFGMVFVGVYYYYR